MSAAESDYLSWNIDKVEKWVRDNFCEETAKCFRSKVCSHTCCLVITN